MATDCLIWEEQEYVGWLRFRLPTGYLDPERLAEITVPDTKSHTSGVVFSGKTPTWLAARLTHIALVDREYAWVGLDTARSDGTSNTSSVVRIERDQHVAEPIGPSPLAIATSEHDGYVVLWFNILTEADGRKGILDATQLNCIRLPDVGDTRRGVVFCGPGPTWLFAQLAHLAYPKFSWCAVCSVLNPGARATVVWSQDPTKPIGSYVPRLDEGEDPAIHLGPFDEQFVEGGLQQRAVAIIGAAHSGKSMLTYGLSECSRVEPKVWVLRANPDGEGHWSNETSDALRDTYREQVKRNWDFAFAERMAGIVRNLRRKSNVLFVDLAGLCSDELRLILKECSHAILLRRADGVGSDECNRFIAACEVDGVELIAELTSQLDATASAVTVESISGRLGGVVAGLVRGNRTVGERCEPFYRALMERLADD